MSIYLLPIFRVVLGSLLSVLFLYVCLGDGFLKNLFFNLTFLFSSLIGVIWTLRQKVIIFHFNAATRTITKRIYSLINIATPEEWTFSSLDIETLVFKREVWPIPGGFEQQFSLTIKQKNNGAEILIVSAAELPLFSGRFAKKFASKLNTSLEERTLRHDQTKKKIVASWKSPQNKR